MKEGIIITIIGTLILIGMVIVFYADVAKQEAFMKECLEDKKKYECDYMWRAGEPDYIPLFIPIPTR